MMRYRVYSGPPGTGDVSLLRQEELLFKEFDGLDNAILWARHLERHGRHALLIEGDDGTRMNKRAIVEAIRVSH